MSRQITIHHFEDEPDSMHWLPGVLLNRYWEEHPEWIEGDGACRESSDETEVRFDLRPPGGPLTLLYRVYPDKEQFDRAFDAKPGDIVLLDVMCELPDRTLRTYGIDFFPQACEAVGSDRVFFITAYPASIPDEVLSQLPTGDHLIAKPVDPTALCSVLVEKLGLG